MRLRLLRGLLILTLALPTTAAAQVKIKASYGSPSLTQVIFPLGVQAGMFQRNGLAAEAVYIAGRSISALLGGDVQFAFVGGPQTIQARVSGADLIVIGGLNRLGQMIVVHRRSRRLPISSAKRSVSAYSARPRTTACASG